MEKTQYTAVRLPGDIAAELKLWRQAFGTAAARPVTYGEVMRAALDALAGTRPDEAAEMKAMLDRHPELKGTVGLKI